MKRNPMRRITALMALMGWSFLAAAAPKARVEPERLDLGNLKASQQSTGTIKIFNDGDAPLEIIKIQASCGCTSVTRPEGEKARIAPGANLELPIAYTAKDKPGKESSVVVVTTNDPARPALTVPLTAYVNMPVFMRPASGLMFEQSPRGQEIRRSVVLVPSDPAKEIELLSIATEQKGIQVSGAKVTRNGQQMEDVS